MKKNAIIITAMLMGANIIVKILGLVRDVVMANTYGTSIYTDAYVVASNIPIVIFSVVAAAISTSFIPIYSEIREKKGSRDALKFTNNFINILLIVCLIITFIGELFPDFLVKVFAYGFNSEQYSITVEFTKILLLNILVLGVMSVAGSYLQLNEDFMPISYSSIPNNLVVILSVVISYYTNNPYILAIGTVLGTISQFVYYYPFIKKNGYKYEFIIDFKDKYLRKVFFMIIPVFIGAAVDQVNTIVDKSLVSGLEEGSIASLNYASKLIGFITGVFIVSIITIVYPKMSELSAKFDLENLKKYLREISSYIIILIIPITFISIIYSKDIVSIIFERGSFGSKSTYMTSLALSAYSVGLIGIGVREVITKAYFSLKDTKTPMFNGIIGIIINIILSVVLINTVGFFGSAIATSLTSIVISILLIIKLQKNIGVVFNKKFIFNTTKIVLSAFIAVCGCSFIFRYTYNIVNNDSVVLRISLMGVFLIITIIVYLLSLYILNEDNIKKILNILKGKLMKGKSRYEK